MKSKTLQSERVGSIPALPDDNPQIEMARKHNIVQEVLVNEVYLSGSPSLVEECGFGEGEEGYVR